MHKSQNGFSFIHIILALFIVAISGGIGWYVWDRNKETSDTSNNPGLSTVPKPTTKKKSNNKEAIDPYANWKWVNIKELGVRVAYPNTWNYESEMACDGSTLNGIAAPSEEVVANNLHNLNSGGGIAAKYGIGIIALTLVKKSNCASTEQSINGLSVSTNSELVEKGLLTGKYISFLGIDDKIHQLFITSKNYTIGSKLDESTTLYINNKPAQLFSSISMGQYGADVSNSDFKNSNLYKISKSIIESISLQ